MAIKQIRGWRQLIAGRSNSQAAVTSARPLVFLIVDDHDAVLQCLVPALSKSYPEATLQVAQDCETALQQIERYQPNLIILDLELPETFGKNPVCETGLSLLKMVMQLHPVSNILVLGNTVKPLIRIRSDIYQYSAGFVATDKSQSVHKILELVQLALRRSIYLPPDVRARADFKPKWITVLALKFQVGLSDKAIAKQMGISIRTLRNYWLAIQDALEVHDNPNKDLRIQIEQAARQAGLID